MLIINELRSTLTTMEQVLGVVDEAIVWTDADGKILWCNATFDKLVEEPHVANLGSLLAERLPLLESDMVSACDKHPVMLALEPNTKGLCIYGLKRSNKLLVLEVAWSSFPEKLLDQQGYWSAVLVIRDVTERHQAEVALKEAKLLLEQQVIALEQADIQIRQQNEELNRLNIELIRANRLKNEFLSTMSHELRTPLNAILGMAEGLQEEVFGELNERQKLSLSTIERSGSHLLGLIADILEVAKIGAGQLDLTIQTVLVSQLCNASLAVIKPKATQKHIQLEATIQAGLTEISVDLVQMRQVLNHLLENAVKFTPAGGRVTLNVQLESSHLESDLEKLEGSLGAQPHGSAPIPESCSLCFSITDTGIGIVNTQLDQLFQPFIQLDSNLNRKYEGTGLGLFLVKQIVDLHGGQITVQSELGKGSCFTVRLPQSCTLTHTLAASPANRQPQPQLTEPIPEATLDVLPLAEHSSLLLLVGENEATLRTISSYLKARGYDILLAKTEQEAIAITNAQHPNLIVMDTPMPKLDRQIMSQQMRHDANRPDLPIIALMTPEELAKDNRRLKSDYDHQIAKPINFKQLTATIQALLAIRESH